MSSSSRPITADPRPKDWEKKYVNLLNSIDQFAWMLMAEIKNAKNQYEADKAAEAELAAMQEKERVNAELQKEQQQQQQDKDKKTKS